MGWFSLRNVASVAAAPFTGGASLLAMENGNGKSVIGDLTGANAASKANEANIANQNKWNNIQVELANTAHQREMADYKKAGLNPVLTVGSGGAATPGLTAPQVQNEMPGGYMAQLGSLSSVASNFANARQMMAQSGLQQAQTANEIAQNPWIPKEKKASIENTMAQTQLANARTIQSGHEISNLDAKTKREIEERRKTQTGVLGKTIGTNWGGYLKSLWNGN